ncbi:phosphodiesterase [Mycobacterium sp. HUMS_1102779]|uniref:phosphodiesterase n=1 Tax=Mycobacterium sp. HUMS_1102779 TaxID=3383487 RepID=UPI00389A6291
MEPLHDLCHRLAIGFALLVAMPDFVMLAVRLRASTPWDVLAVSSGSGVLARAVALRPAATWTGQTMTSLMPFGYRGRNWWLRARICSDIDGPGLSLSAVRERLVAGGIEVALDQACGRGDLTPLARLRMTGLFDPAPGGDVSFDPVINLAPGLSLRPAWLAGLRASAYRRSREGRDGEAVQPARPDR